MQLVEKHIIKKSHSFFNECDNLCFLSKNLYNSGLYEIRQHYFKTNSHINYYGVNKLFVSNNQVDYRKLPSKVSNQTLMLLDKNFKSFFSLLKKKNNKGYDKPIRIPKYLDKNGRFITTYEKGALLKKIFDKFGLIQLSKTNIKIKTNIKNWDSINQVRILPRCNQYVIEVIYTIDDVDMLVDNGNYASIDMGVNNLSTIAFNNGNNPLIINGKPLKSMNQYYNKLISKTKSKLKKKHNKNKSKKTTRITNKRNNKVNDYLHKTSRYIVNHLVENNINTLVIGNNKGWKQDIKIGKINNQNFVNIPFTRLIEMLTYKCKLVGINLIIREESYTSKCSFLDNEPIKKHSIYMGCRSKRGLFISYGGTKINADVNGAFNIMRKVFPNLFKDGIVGVSVHPIKVKIPL